jgi:hypothetical protein
MVAGAQTYNVNLSGAAGTGFASIGITGDAIDYAIVTSGLDPAPTTATLTDGSDSVDLGASFGGTGSATGSTNSAMASAISGNPSAWSLEVSNGSDTLSGALSVGGGSETVVYFPVAATIVGLAGTNFKTDGRIVNRSGEAASVTLEYYPAGAGGNIGPAGSETITVGANEQAVLTNFVEDFFGVSDGRGGVKVTADRTVLVSARVYNDQTTDGNGTFGLYIDAVSLDQAYHSGLVSFLENQLANTGTGFRGSIGWFNPSSTAVEVTFRGWDTSGDLLGETTRTIAGLAHDQSAVNQLWPSLANYGDMYVTYTADGDIFIYGTITDNISGDGTYIPAALSN